MKTDLNGVTQRRVATNGIELNIAEKGASDAPLVILVHGFPESWYSWRHQIQPIVDAGYHVVVPDLRGYGKSDKPHAVEDYNAVTLANDVVGLIPSLGYDDAIVIGHDWGAMITWRAALDHPDKVRAMGALSVPFMPRSPVPPLAAMKMVFQGQFFYQLYFQEEGVAEAEFEADIYTAIKKFLIMGAGETDLSSLPQKGPDADMLTGLPNPDVLPDWLTEEDLQFYANEFENSGMRGPINFYRNHDLTWELTKDARTVVDQPSMFIAGANDGVIMLAAEAYKAMPNFVTDLRVNELIPGAGHWTQQEAPERVNELIVQWLADVDG